MYRRLHPWTEKSNGEDQYCDEITKSRVLNPEAELEYLRLRYTFLCT